MYSVLMNKEIIIFETESGKQPFVIWLNSIKDNVFKVRIFNKITMLKCDNVSGDFKSVGDGVYELRFFFGPGYRVYFAFDGNKIIILLCGGDKSTQKKDIKKAKEYLIDYKQTKRGTKW